MSESERRAEARQDPRLRARIVTRRALRLPPDPRDPERPPHVRAASGLSWWEGRLAAVQDDALWVVRIDPATGECEPVPLPAEPGGARLFDEARGNKRRKPDLEACLVADPGGALVGFGSGSTPHRERLLLLRPAEAARWVDASALYARLRAEQALCGGALNLEGAALLAGGATLRLLQRGNGAPRDGVRPWSASCDLPWAPLAAALERAEPPPAPAPARVTRWELGALQGVPLGFTDAALAPGGRLAFLAAAEDSPDAIADGAVTGSVLGVMDAHATAGRWAPLVDDAGAAAPLKAEGLTLAPGEPSRAWVVLDPDDPDRPSELLELALDGPWWS